MYQNVTKEPKLSREPRVQSGFLRSLVRWSGRIVMIIATVLALQIYLNGFVGGVKCMDETGFLRQLLCGISVTCADYAPYLRNFPSDEEMIENFHKHRAEFERLVQIYRNDLSVPTNLNSLEPTREVRAVMDRIHVAHVRGDGVLWLPPDPYSKKLNPEWDKLERMSRLYSPEKRQFSGVILSYAHAEVLRFDYGTRVHKRYYYIPFTPKVDNGVLVLPVAGIMGFPRVAQTLSKYPPFEWPFECFCRQIEPQWFIEMCQEKAS
jgi:hypothetical protein